MVSTDRREVVSAAPTVAARHYLMCPPLFYGVEYSTNPWMRPAEPVDRALGLRQWEALRETHLRLGHRVEVIDPVAGLPDMVFAADSAIIVDGKVLASRFRHEERRGEEAAYRSWFAARGLPEVRVPEHASEGEGDFAVAGPWLLAGTGFRSHPGSHREAQELFGWPVIGLRLVDPRFYHLDTALCVLDDDDIMYYPDAFSAGSRRVLERMFPDALLATLGDAEAFGLNAVSDGGHVILPATAGRLAKRLRARGYRPAPVDMSEFLKAGGGVKCCTLKVRR